MDCETTLKGEMKMKKFAAIAAIMMMTTAPVFAAQGGFSGPSATPAQTQTQQGGFVDNDANLTTAAKVKDLKDDSWVKLRGNITERLSLRYGVGVFEPANTIALRYQLSRRLYLEAASGLASSLDLFYRRDF